ncbi:MAG TPA: xylulokinase, partial [Candidatus Atribacteria bacterium]|nr:xylulokinase [Candidatus Atribacteria bacterium]
MRKDCILGIDIGTTGVKVVLFDKNGSILESEYREYPLYTLSFSMVEQDPKDWISSLIDAVRSLKGKTLSLSYDIVAIGIDGQMHTSALLDKEGNILRRAITWMDQRSKDIVKYMDEEQPGRDFIFKHTYNFPTTTYLLPNLLWIKEHEPNIYASIDKVLVAKDYVKYWLTGEIFTDPSDASGTLLFDVKNLNWSSEMMSYFSIPNKWFPPVRASTEIIGSVTKEAASLLGISEGIPVVNGCADHAATYIGGGVITKDEG